MKVLGPFPDMQAVVREVVKDLGSFGVQTDATLQDRLPFITATETGGSDNRFTDTTDMEVSVFTADYSGKALADTIRQRLLATPIVTSVGTVDYSVTSIKPREIPWTDGATVRRWVATYRLSARR